MIDIAKYHRKSGDDRAVARFFASAIFKDVQAFLTKCGYDEKEIVKRTNSYRGAPSVAMVHPMVVVEYLRWLDYDRYAAWVMKKIEEDRAQATEGEKA